nr:GTPase [Acinetobacter sp. Marseille-Q1620]
MTNKEITEAFQHPRQLTRETLSFAAPNVNAVSTWALSLSIMPLGDASRAILNALLELSELQCTETLRFDLIQALHPNIENILTSLEKFFFNQSLIHSDRNEHIIELGLNIRGYFICIYLDIVRRSDEQLSQTKFTLLSLIQKKHLKTARLLSTYYALQQLSSLLYKQQMLYTSAITQQWIIIHSLYDLAFKNNEAFVNINLIQGTHYSLNNIYQVYAQLLLLDIFNTNQIRPDEIQALYQCSFDWAKMIQITPKETSLSRYFVNKKIDHASIYNKKNNQGLNAHLFIETQYLLEHINTTIIQDENYISKVEKQFLTPALKFHVQNVLGTTSERRHERYEYSAQLKICFSLLAAHYFLSHSKTFSESLLAYQKFFLHSDLSNRITVLDQNDLSLPPNRLLDRECKQVYHTEVLDISLNGYRIRWTGDTPRSLRTGEFILVSETINQKWKGAVVRWIKQASNKSLELGLEVLGQDVFACAVRLQADLQNMNYQPALFIQNCQLENNEYSLILPNLSIFKEKQNIQLRLADHEMKIRLEKALLITQSFIQFSFNLINSEQQLLIEDFIFDQSDHSSLGET